MSATSSSRIPPRIPLAARPALNLPRKLGNRAFAGLVHPPAPPPAPEPAAPAPPSTPRFSGVWRWVFTAFLRRK